ncbi:hypothetical protein G6F70_006871 [Rhizopus microsporus]|nr:hypothetical protein G6F71_006851 [Rhizopus microsporus]KAG1197146.1 hypothetical protein G6F70_006871 [Rhizopus microsporus]KAG1209012.1 hypothetical protein G6F69_006723 [Rhizopus microsporus]KAG1228215.1 hypothetical protein G6F67_007965 [Rhizopus microsporus]KAG1258894.1 hypothetical protein G6F68_008487 [Rhizopus microsporus]
MFKKPIANIKTFSPLRSSDRRHFQNEAIEAYPVLKDQYVMPNDLRSAKFIAQTSTHGIVYTSADQPLWISFENMAPVPTVYTMWKHPDMLPILYTWTPVIQKLMEGADLMIPGIVPGPSGTLPELRQGDLVAITIRGYAYPLAVGTMALPTSEIKPRSGMKGKAVHVIHVYQDFLWAMGDKSEPPGLEQADDESEQEEVNADEEPNENNNDNLNIEQEPPKRDLSTEEIDSILKTSLYQALVYKLTSDHASQLPMPASSFYSAYIMPCRPVGAEAADIKKSSWKKLQKFLKAMEKTGLLKTKEQRGEVVIMSVNWSHPCLQNVAKYKTIEQTDSSTPQTQTQVAHADHYPQADIQELFKPLGTALFKLFEEAEQDTEALYTYVELRTMLTNYIKQKELANPRNQKMVRLNAVLCDALLSKAEYRTIDELPRDQLLTRLCSKMQPFHTIQLPEQKEPILRKGHPKPVEIVQEIRQGRKTVTKVTGVEAFGLDVDELVKEFTKLCASSVTSAPIHGVSPKNPLYQIMIQGPQIKNVTEAMLHKGVPKKFIEATDKTQKKKK